MNAKSKQLDLFAKALLDWGYIIVDRDDTSITFKVDFDSRNLKYDVRSGLIMIVE